MRKRLLVLDAYSPEGREALRGAGGTEAGRLYADLLCRLSSEVEVEIGYAAEAAALPSGRTLSDYAGVVWTGSNLSIHHAGDERVRRQVEFARGVSRTAIPSFGSCWAAQIAVVAAGGACAPNARGRELGVSRKIRLGDAGRAHPLFAGKPDAFDALTCHADHATRLPDGARLLAGNEWSPVQAVSIESGASSFWAVQYHPEYDLHEVACMFRLRGDDLVEQGTFGARAEVDAWIDDLEALHLDPSRRDLAEKRAIGPDVLDPALRTREVRNWLERKVLA